MTKALDSLNYARRWAAPLLVAGGLLAMALPGTASAQSQAWTNSGANLRAGPGGDYPVVARLAPGMPLSVYGCIAGFSWCDVAVPGARGWIYGGLLSYPYQGNRAPVLNYGAYMGLPIITFAIGSYWGDHYRGRPWYNDQRYWHRPPPPPPRPGWGGPGPRPPGHGAGPGPRPPGHGAGPGPRPPGHGAGPGPRPPGHDAGPGPGGNRPPGQGGGRPPGHGGGGDRGPGGGDRGHGGGDRGHGGGDRGHGGDRPRGGPDR